MYKIGKKLLLTLYNEAYQKGITATLSKKTFENTEEKLDEWIKKNLSNKL